MSYMHDHVKKNHSVGISVNAQKPKYLTLLFYFFFTRESISFRICKTGLSLHPGNIFSKRAREQIAPNLLDNRIHQEMAPRTKLTSPSQAWSWKKERSPVPCTCATPSNWPQDFWVHRFYMQVSRVNMDASTVRRERNQTPIYRQNLMLLNFGDETVTAVCNNGSLLSDLDLIQLDRKRDFLTPIQSQCR